MSTSRADITAALGTVPGITTYPNRPPALQPYSAWPQIVRTAPQTMGCGIREVTWYVWVSLPAEHAATIDPDDELAAGVEAALNRTGAAIFWEPQPLIGDEGGSTVPALRYEFRTN